MIEVKGGYIEGCCKRLATIRGGTATSKHTCGSHVGKVLEKGFSRRSSIKGSGGVGLVLAAGIAMALSAGIKDFRNHSDFQLIFLDSPVVVL